MLDVGGMPGCKSVETTRAHETSLPRNQELVLPQHTIKFQRLRRWFEQHWQGCRGAGLLEIPLPAKDSNPCPSPALHNEEAVCSIRLVQPLYTHRDSARNRRVGSSLKQLPVHKPHKPTWMNHEEEDPVYPLQGRLPD